MPDLGSYDKRRCISEVKKQAEGKRGGAYKKNPRHSNNVWDGLRNESCCVYSNGIRSTGKRTGAISAVTKPVNPIAKLA